MRMERVDKGRYIPREPRDMKAKAVKESHQDHPNGKNTHDGRGRRRVEVVDRQDEEAYGMRVTSADQNTGWKGMSGMIRSGPSSRVITRAPGDSQKYNIHYSPSIRSLVGRVIHPARFPPLEAPLSKSRLALAGSS